VGGARERAAHELTNAAGDFPQTRQASKALAVLAKTEIDLPAPNGRCRPAAGRDDGNLSDRPGKTPVSQQALPVTRTKPRPP
jgi:hypothetical protein